MQVAGFGEIQITDQAKGVKKDFWTTSKAITSNLLRQTIALSGNNRQKQQQLQHVGAANFA